MNPMQTMIGGNHYNVSGLDPNTFAMANGWDPCAYNILRYIARHRVKGGKEDCQKARHYVDIRTALLTKYPGGFLSPIGKFSMEQFVIENDRFLMPIDLQALAYLEGWVLNKRETASLALADTIERIISVYG